MAQERVGKHLPLAKTSLVVVLKWLNQARLDYMNNNYQEEAMPALLLFREEHKQYLETT